MIKKIHQVSQLKTKQSAYCVCNNEPSIVPTLDTKIRWNSLLDFCIQTLRIFKSLVQLSSIKEIDVVLTMADKEAIDDFIYILTPFKKATIDLCGENDINGSKVYLILRMLQKHITNLKQDTNFEKYTDAFENMERKFNKYGSVIEEYSLITHVLDPRFKMEFIRDRSLKTATLKSVQEKYKQLSEKINISPTVTLENNNSYKE